MALKISDMAPKLPFGLDVDEEETTLPAGCVVTVEVGAKNGGD